jgi:hypothetical protein
MPACRLLIIRLLIKAFAVPALTARSIPAPNPETTLPEVSKPVLAIAQFWIREFVVCIRTMPNACSLVNLTPSTR